jgi:hypothetical protein
VAGAISAEPAAELPADGAIEDDGAMDSMGSDDIDSEVMASDEAEVAAAAEVLLSAVVELDPQAASVRARAAPATPGKY